MSQFKRSLNFRSTIAIVIGGIIGSGIFMKPALMASQLGSPFLLLSVWLVAGIVTLLGALSNAEIAAMFPETGGQYVFFQKMYGNGFAFMYGWAAFAVFNCGGNASIAYVCAQYLHYFIALPQLPDTIVQSCRLHIPLIGNFMPLDNIGLKLVTMLLVMVLTLINYRSVQYGAGLQRWLTSLKIIAMLLLVGGIGFSGKGNMHFFTQNSSTMPVGLSLISAYMAAIAGAFWAYDGWNNISFVAGEVQNPQKNIPKSLIIGLLLCISIYALINTVYIYVLPIQQMASSSFVASDAATKVWGIGGGAMIALLVILSTVGTANANILATARVTYTMGKENSLFAWAGKEQNKYNTPGNALLLNACWSVVLILSGSFDMLTDMLIFVSWFFYGMSALGVFILRKKYAQKERPYKVWGYPLVPVIFIVFTLFFLVVTVYTDIKGYRAGHTQIINSFWGIAITLTGLPLYFLFRKK
ncbi:MAG: amino acid permease [Sphingobacteriia bacterium]|nr:amino acid permease [Sphingobacteriia bacterium]